MDLLRKQWIDDLKSRHFYAYQYPYSSWLADRGLPPDPYVKREVHICGCLFLKMNPDTGHVFALLCRSPLGPVWGIPKGHMEPVDEGNELACAIREAREELNVTVDLSVAKYARVADRHLHDDRSDVVFVFFSGFDCSCVEVDHYETEHYAWVNLGRIDLETRDNYIEKTVRILAEHEIMNKTLGPYQIDGFPASRIALTGVFEAYRHPGGFF